MDAGRICNGSLFPDFSKVQSDLGISALNGVASGTLVSIVKLVTDSTLISLCVYSVRVLSDS